MVLFMSSAGTTNLLVISGGQALLRETVGNRLVSQLEHDSSFAGDLH